MDHSRHAFWMQRMHSQGWAWSMGYITAEVCRVWSACVLLSLLAVGQERFPKLVMRSWSYVRLSQHHPNPGCCKQKLESKQSLHCRPAAPQHHYHEVGLGPEPPKPVSQNPLYAAAAPKNLTAAELGGKANGWHGAGCDAMQRSNSAVLGKA